MVVADTSPLNYLLLIQSHWVLPHLYQRVVIPTAVAREMHHPSTPTLVAEWADALPAWVEIRSVPTQGGPELSHLGDGEREAILLAEVLGPQTVLMDDLQGRTDASRLGLGTTGTLGVVLLADRSGLLRAEEAYERLMRETNFRASAVVGAQFFRSLRGERL